MIEKFLLDKEITKYVLSKGGITFFFRIIAMASSFLTMWFITYYYGENIFGRYSLALTILQITTMIFALGIPVAFVSFAGNISDRNELKGLFFKNLKIALPVALIPSVFFFIGADYIASVVFNKPDLSHYFVILALSIPFLILHEIICYYFMSLHRFVLYGFYLFIIPNVLFILLLILFHELSCASYYTFMAYTLSIIVTSSLGFMAIWLNKYLIKYPLVTAEEILTKSIPMMMSGIFLVLLNWTDILMLGRYESESQIGIYNVAFKVGYLTLFFVVSMNVVIMPKVSELFHKSNFREMKKIINKATHVVIVLTIPLSIILIIFSKEILAIFGAGFVSGSLALILITIGALFNAITGNVDQILNMTNNQKLVRNIFILGFVLNVALNILLIPSLGIIGAATASLVTNLIINSVFVVYIKKKLNFYTFI